MIILGFITTASIAISSELLSSLFYNSYINEITLYTRTLSFSIIAVFLQHIYGYGFLTILGKENIIRNFLFWNSVVAFIISMIVIPKFAALGAISLTLASRFLIAITMYLTFRKLKSIDSKIVSS